MNIISMYTATCDYTQVTPSQVQVLTERLTHTVTP